MITDCFFFFFKLFSVLANAHPSLSSNIWYIENKTTVTSNPQNFIMGKIDHFTVDSLGKYLILKAIVSWALKSVRTSVILLNSFLSPTASLSICFWDRNSCLNQYLHEQYGYFPKNLFSKQKRLLTISGLHRFAHT